MRVAAAREIPSLTGEFIGETHWVLECTHNHPPTQESAAEGPSLLVGSRGSTASRPRVRKWHGSLLDPSPTYSDTTQQHGLLYPVKYLRLCHLQCNSYTETKKYGPNERTDQSSKNRIKWWKDSQPIRCTVQTLVIRMLTEMAEYGRKVEEKLRLCKVKWREMYREPPVKGRKPGTKSMIWNRRKK